MVKPTAPKKAPTKAKNLATHKKAASSAASVNQQRKPKTEYTAELASQICDHIASGLPLRAIAAMPGMPALSTMMVWLDGRHAEFTEQYARAREAQADKMAEEILSIADEECTMVRADKHGSKDDDGSGNTEVLFDATAVARNRLRVDARKWLASKMAPKKYGDKIQAEHSGPNGGAIEVRSTVRLVKAAPAESQK